MSRIHSPLRLAGKYLHYYLTAANGKGHGIHSPFVFDFVTTVLNDHHPYPAYAKIEGLRQNLLKDHTLLPIEDMGAGSAYAANRSRSVAALTRHAAKPARLGQLLFRIAHRYQPATILEMGTSLGLSAAYLAAGSPHGRVFTIEGARAVANAAGQNLRALGFDATVVGGHFDEQLIPLLDSLPPIDLAFVDGNHRREPTLRYFETLLLHCSPSAALVFDDIHWSPGMEAAWTTIKNDPRVYLTIDLFFIGIVFLREEFKVPQNFTIRY
jgi:predicted O-methyltransferase YrrM